jgi:hypothetical protein
LPPGAVLCDCDRVEVLDSFTRERVVLQCLTEALSLHAQRAVSEIVSTDVSTRLALVEERYGKRGGSSDRVGNKVTSDLSVSKDAMSRRAGTSAIVSNVPSWLGDDEGLQVCIMPMYS